jgi:hypothetical protein
MMDLNVPVHCFNSKEYPLLTDTMHDALAPNPSLPKKAKVCERNQRYAGMSYIRMTALP